MNNYIVSIADNTHPMKNEACQDFVCIKDDINNDLILWYHTLFKQDMAVEGIDGGEWMHYSLSNVDIIKKTIIASIDKITFNDFENKLNVTSDANFKILECQIDYSKGLISLKWDKKPDSKLLLCYECNFESNSKIVP